MEPVYTIKLNNQHINSITDLLNAYLYGAQPGDYDLEELLDVVNEIKSQVNDQLCQNYTAPQ